MKTQQEQKSQEEEAEKRRSDLAGFQIDPDLVRLAADDEFRMDALLDVLQTRMIKRAVPVKNLKIGDLVQGTGQSVRRVVSLTQGIPQDVAKKIVKAVKDGGFKKTQASIQGDEIRVTSPSKDELQSVIAMLRGEDFGIELKFGNYRG